MPCFHQSIKILRIWKKNANSLVFSKQSQVFAMVRAGAVFALPRCRSCYLSVIYLLSDPARIATP
jgi:hypothetical protein